MWPHWSSGFIDIICAAFPKTEPPEAFAVRDKANPVLRISIADIVIVCHFFTTDEIEFDIDPRKITSQAALDGLLGFLRQVGDTVDRPVILTYESDEQHPFISYDPNRREFEYRGNAA